VSRHTLEREVKFSIQPDFVLPRLPGTRLHSQIFTSTYYDTDDYRLLRGGLTLRYRTKARSGTWQLKLPLEDARLEAEFPGPRREPPEALTRVLWAHLRGEALRPIAEIRTRRHGVRVRENGGAVAVTLDAVDVIENGKPKRHFAEAEAELVGGDEKSLRRIAKVLKKAGAIKSDQRPKMLQALDLAPFTPDAPASRALPQLEHLKTFLKRQLVHLLVHDVGVRLRSDPEHVHQMRVTTRRLRAVLRAARGTMLGVDWVEHLRAELSAVGAALGGVRDLDVLLAHLRLERPNVPVPERRAMPRILEALEHERRVRRRALLEMLVSDRYRTLLEHLEAAAGSPVVTDANARLDEIAGKEFAKLRKAVRKVGKDPGDTELHRVRIKSKRARYAAELAEGVRGKPATRFIERVKRLQDLLGEHHDGVVAEQVLRTVVPPDGDRRMALAVGLLLERQRERRREAREAFPKAWSAVKKCGRAVWS